ncbi:divalent-cation tolerance protein CutA [Streptomyces sp. 5.8]|uniref:divalent-cation tolerance protein CutA n=1 Tax=Streptomyces sp. 5.8 TaxID=3406571 RepID=UPI003BB49111
MADFLQVSTATADRESAEELARAAVRARRAAGAQVIGPVFSAFWHEGEFGTGEEWQLLFKIRADQYAELERHLLEHHPWKNPEITAIPIVAGAPDYLRWLATSATPKHGR